MIAALGLLPLYLLGRIGWDEQTARIATGLYAVIPAQSLVVMHLDQVLFPTLALALLILTWSTARLGSLAVGLVAGVCAYLTFFVTFALLGLAPLCLALFLAGLVRSGRRRQALFAGLAAMGSLVVCHLLAIRYWGYDALSRFDRAMAVHSTWKAGTPGMPDSGIGYWLPVNLLDWSYWLGWSVAALCLVALVRALGRHSFERHLTLALSLGLAVALLLLGAFSGTTGETGRLWLFLMPVAALLAAAAVRDVGGRLRTELLWALLAGQVVLTLLMKVRADF